MPRSRGKFGFRLTVALTVGLTSACVTGGKPAKVSAVPPAPQSQPTHVDAPSAPEPPISYVQTVVTLPRPQPIPPDSIGEPPTDDASVRTQRMRPPNIPSIKEQTPAGESRATETPRSVAPAPEEPAPALTRTDESARPRAQIVSRWNSVRDGLATLKDRKRTPELDASIARLESLLGLADRALRRGNLRQADSLTERAEVIARDLLRAR